MNALGPDNGQQKTPHEQGFEVYYATRALRHALKSPIHTP